MKNKKTPKKSTAKTLVAPEYNLGERLKFFREIRNMTQNQLARLASVSQATIAHIEKGSKDPSIETIKKLAVALDTHIATLFASDEVYVFDLKRLRRKYNDANKLTPHLYMAVGKVVQFARDIGFLT